MKYILCLECSRAWLAPVAASCCGARPLECSPWSSDARVWYRARLTSSGRACAVYEAAHHTDQQHKWRSLHRGIVARGNTSARH